MVDSWIIQDGNYGDFAVGDKAKFALEFAGSDLRPSTLNRAEACDLGNGVYRVCAQVLFVEESVWVIDFGFRAFWESDPPHFAVKGQWVEGEVHVGIDPYFYTEYLHKLPQMPGLFYKWKVLGILRNETPWLVEENDRGGKIFHRDQTRRSWVRTARTDAWNDDSGRSSYVLELAVDDGQQVN